ncbi:UvrB/UvrC motif-containing protein [Bacillus sp. FJAT-27251]|uniref:UvrB/UvrC motif-containing protein n=1 Tax=Bacillus sp. FJAT-27251 TaxID=1684142 RepID=UPI0006A7965E|nr:UvrB/UvrC motif-containing protein [Bacillus sp. FJAT-27251]
MICQECNQRPATLHFTNFSNGEKTEMHLCERCAQEKGEMFMMNQGPGFSINNLLAGLLNMEPAFKTKAKEPFPQEKVIQCDNCSLTFPQFVKIGRFGCAHCYDAFREQLSPVIRRLHSGNSTHNGKVPQRIGGSIQLQRNIASLKNTLSEHIAREEFEKAVELRDQIRALEKELAEKQRGGE